MKVVSLLRYSQVISHPEPAPSDSLDDDARPWSMAVNTVARASDAELTVLSLVLVGRTIRLTAALKVPLHPDIWLRSAPSLVRRDGSEPPLQWLRAHVSSEPPLFWLDWAFERPIRPLGALTGCIESLELVNRTGSKSEIIVGPWRFDIGRPKPMEPPALLVRTGEWGESHPRR